MPKYKPLTDRLSAELAKPSIHEVILTFDEISTLVNGLPSSAMTPGWWSNVGDSQTVLPHLKAWDDAGCFVDRADLKANPPQITFHKGRSNHGNGFVDLAADAAVPHTPFMLVWSWTRLGAISRGTLSLHPGAKLELIFPRPPESPGVYCFRFRSNTIDNSYVGKARDFRERLLDYRSARGETEHHVEAALHASMDEGSVPEILIAPTATLSLAADSWPLDASDDLSLVLLEHAAIACEKRAGRTLINRVRRPRKT